MSYTYDADIVSDLFKDAYGYRPREGFWQRWDSATDAERQEQWDWLLQVCKRRAAEEAEEEQRAIAEFELLVAITITSGAQDRETALRWIMDSSRCDGDWEFLCYEHGLPYGYFRKAA